MRILNFHYRKFRIGTKVIMTKDYVNGNVTFRIGESGVVYDITIEHFPDMGLFDLRILHISFKNGSLHMGDQVAENIMDVL